MQGIDDELADDEELFPLSAIKGRGRWQQQAGGGRVRRKTSDRVGGEAIELAAREDEFTTTYVPARHERAWLRASLRPFYDQELMTDVLAQVKGGKEANVYRCQAHPAVGTPWLAAKVYRPRQFRNLSNDRVYREGRQVLTANGSPVKETDHRVMRALGKKTTFGNQVAHTSWLMHEFTTLERLHRAGAAVPQPLAASENAILMSYHGDGAMAAPTLNTVRLEPDEAADLFNEILRNVDLMLQMGLIHGDLSAYNVLYWEGTVTLIDFPQVTNCQGNSQAEFILRRDLTRLCEYFASQGVRRDPRRLADDLWQRYVALDPEDEAADASRLAEVIAAAMGKDEPEEDA
jgi:RIO kinase 1